MKGTVHNEDRIMNGSPRANGNTTAMVEAFARGAKEAGHAVETVCVGTMKINGCRSCGWCRGAGKGVCVQQDDMQKVYPVIKDAEMIVFVSPIYYFTMSAQIQAAIQRFYVWGQHPTMKKGCLLLSSYSPNVYDGAVGEYRGILRYFGAADCGIVTSDNTTNKTEAKLNECYDLGESVK